ncbi:MAG: PIN domain-containing protein [Acidimicrobiia bacterium]
MTAAPVVFLDANVLFSAALGGPVFELLLDLARRGAIRAVTSSTCRAEAQVNLERKRPDRLDALSEDVLSVVAVDIASGADFEQWARDLTGPADAHVLASARVAGAAYLVTGDTTHFGSLMDRDDLPLRVRTPRQFLLEGPN